MKNRLTLFINESDIRLNKKPRMQFRPINDKGSPIDI